MKKWKAHAARLPVHARGSGGRGDVDDRVRICMHQLPTCCQADWLHRRPRADYHLLIHYSGTDRRVDMIMDAIDFRN